MTVPTTDPRLLWRSFPRGAHRHFVVLRCSDLATGQREYYRGGGTGQKVSQYRSQAAADEVARQLNRDAQGGEAL